MMSVKLLSIRIREIEENRLYMDADGLRMREQECQHYSAFLNPSLDILEFRRLAKKREEKTGEKVIYSRGSVEYTDVFVSMTMSKNSPTPQALRRILKALSDDGYRFVTVSELSRVE